jgi:hypothetical protein
MTHWNVRALILIAPLYFCSLNSIGDASIGIPVAALVDPIVVPNSELNTSAPRRERLRSLFQRITASAITDQQKVEAFVFYIQDQIYHPFSTPVDENGTAIYDPLWILDHRVGQCGQTNRVLVDAFEAAGFEARLIQLNGHVAAEVYFDKAWHYVDADGLSFHRMIKDEGGRIPSALEIYERPQLVSGLISNEETRKYPRTILAAEGMPDISPPFPYENVFIPWTDPTTGLSIPFAYVKTATPEQESNTYYGWNYYRSVSLRPLH